MFEDPPGRFCAETAIDNARLYQTAEAEKAEAQAAAEALQVSNGELDRAVCLRD
jgi:hypothetical protein